MTPFLKVPGLSLKSFFSGVAMGFFIVLLLRGVGEAWYSYQVRQISGLTTTHAGAFGKAGLVLAIFSRNFSITLLLTLLPLILMYHTLVYRSKRPFKSGDFAQRLAQEIHFTLTIYSVSVVFVYGAVVFGFFLAYVLNEYSFPGLFQLILYFIPHGFLETYGILLAASAGIIMRDAWLRNPEARFSAFWRKISKREYFGSFLFLLVILFLSAVVEVYFSRGFMKFSYGVLAFLGLH
ncbi:MAG: stage II sporulation protein M [Candidatus Bathyarchaeota archaeon]|nr:stage II sporulation protein M [Candidatus Bathyarchaeota archaeon]